MRYRSLGWILLGAWIGVWPLAAHADYLSDAREALKKGDIRSQRRSTCATRSAPTHRTPKRITGWAAFRSNSAIRSLPNARRRRPRPGLRPPTCQPTARPGVTGTEQVRRAAETAQARRQGPRPRRHHPGVPRLRGSRTEAARRRRRKRSPTLNRRRRMRSSRCWPKRGCWRRGATQMVPRRRSTMRSQCSRNRPKHCSPSPSSCARKAT